MEPPIKMHSQNDETRNEHWYFSMLNTKHYQIIPALSPICWSGIYQLFFFKVLQFANHWRRIHVTRHGSGIPKNSSYVGHEEKKLTVFSQDSPGFFAPRKRAQIKFTGISDMQKGHLLHDPVICIQETLPEIRQSKSGFWGCCDDVCLCSGPVVRPAA